MRPTMRLLDHFKLAIVGGGCGGLSVASKFARILGSGNVTIIEPRHDHYYQPGFTLVGGGLMKLDELIKKQKDLIPKDVNWIDNKVNRFEPKNNKLILDNGKIINYDYLVIATGIELRFDLIKGLSDALEKPGVCSIYSPKYAKKTFDEIKKLKKGKAVFTFPNTPIKCPGAPQKICYIAEDYWRKNGNRNDIEIVYNTTLAKIFGVEKYAQTLMNEINARGISLQTRSNLIEVNYDKKMAKFELLDENKVVEQEFDLLHIGPPCSPVESLRTLAKTGDELVDDKGFVNVNSETLQSVKYENVFGIGDCTNSPNSKTAAAISSQFSALKKNLLNVMNDKKPSAKYDGYASCPLVISSDKAILAEFNSQGPLETLPINQSKPMKLAFWMKRYLMPFLYWKLLVKGYWNGPKTIRKILHLGLK